MRFLSSILIISLAPIIIFAQEDWRHLKDDPNADFSEIQALFYAEFGDEPGAKGSGWKQFKRWEYYYEQRLDEDGTLPEPGSVLNEVLEYRETHPEVKSYIAGTGNWEALGPNGVPSNGTGQLNGAGRLNCITFHPTDSNTIYVGAPSGGFWKTTDHGATWTKYVAGLTRLGVSSIVIHPTQPDTIYIGTGDRDAGDAPGYGVWRSIDGGVTWSSHNNGMGNRTVNEILMNPNNPNVLIAATSGNRVYTSTDGGANWNNSSFTGFNPKDLAFHPTNANIIYASGTEFARSIDGGSTWTYITAGVPSGVQRMAVAVSADEPDWVYLLAGDGGGLDGLYRSTDSGVTFSTRATSPNILGWNINGTDSGSQAWYDLVVAADPNDANIVYTGGINMWRSDDAGASFSCISYWVGPSGGVDGVHADQHALEFSPHSDVLYSGNDGGIYLSEDDGLNWTDISDGLGIAQVYKIGVSQQTADLAINGYQDNGTAINQGTDFSTEIGGDGMECIIDPTDDTYMYGALYYGDIRRSTNGGATFSGIAGSISESGAWVTPYKLDPNDANQMFAGFDNVWKNTNVRAGTTWSQISSFGGTSNIVDLAIAPSNSDVMYVSRGGSSNFYRTNNLQAGSPNWTNLEANLPASGTPRDIEIDPTNPSHIFIALGNNIYESTNAGITWTDISGTLPNISLNTIVIDHDSPIDAMYVGMDVGVYYIDNTMVDWSLYATGLPNVEVTELEIHYDNVNCRSTLYAGTYGRGLWKSDLKDPGILPPIACFEASSTDVCLGEVVYFKDYSSFAPTSWTWSFLPDSVMFISGTDANSQNPEVVFGAPGTYQVQLIATNGIGFNVTSKPGYITVSTADIPTAFTTDFEAESLCATTSNCGATTCSLINPLWVNVANGVDDDIDWRVDEGGTPSSNTGPSVDFNPGNSTGNYIYTEASSCFNNEAILESSCMDLDQDYDCSFSYYMEGSNMGELHIDVKYNGVWVEDVVTPLTGDQGAAWATNSFSLAPYTGSVIKLRFRGITGPGFQSDIALDDIAITATSVLPVTLISFDAHLTDQEIVKLQWATATEFNTDYFEIQRSIDGVDWTPVATEKAIGFSNDLVTYQTFDDNPIIGDSYYRLKAVDFDGTFEYSNIRPISFNDSETQLYPNPANTHLIVAGNGISKAEVIILNLMGQKVSCHSRTIEEGKIQLDVSELNNGIYFLQLNHFSGATDKFRFTIAR